MKNLIKILIVLLTVLFFNSSVNALSGEIVTSGSTSNSWLCPNPTFDPIYATGVIIKDVGLNPQPSIITTTIESVYWTGSSESSYWESVDWYIGAVQVGTGTFGYNRDVSGNYHIIAFFDSIDLTGYANMQVINASGFSNMIKTNFLEAITECPNDCAGIGHANFISMGSLGTTQHTITTQYTYQNTYTYTMDTTKLMFDMDRDSNNLRKVEITSDKGSVCDIPLGSTNITVWDYDLNNLTWDIETLDYYNNPYNFEITFVPGAPVDLTKCYLEVNNTDIGDTLEILYYNIDDLRLNPLYYGYNGYETEELYLQLFIDRGTYNELLKSELIINEADGFVYFDTIGYHPGVYYTQINVLYRDSELYAVRESFIISEPSNYSILINPNIAYVGDNVNIIYKALNQSNITVFDNNNTSIDTWINVQGQSQIIYQIPIDSNYNYAYNDWYVYLNDSGNISNNLRYNFTVDWKVYVPPVVVPTPPAEDYDVTIEESVDEIKDAINPLLDLVYGLTSVFVDNPDYDNDQFVTPDELKVWFNSLIPIVVLIVILIGYKVLKRK